MQRKTVWWDATLGVSYLPVGASQLEMVDVLSHQDEHFNKVMAFIRAWIVDEVKRVFIPDGKTMLVNGVQVQKILFTLTVERGWHHG